MNKSVNESEKMALEPLSVVIDRPHLRAYAHGIIGCLAEPDLLDAKAMHAFLKRQGISKLGWRQEVYAAIERLARPVPPPAALPEAALEATIVPPPPPLDAVLIDTNPAVASKVALALAEHGFVLCTGGLPDLVSAAACAAERMHAEGRMRRGATSSGAEYEVPGDYNAGVPVSAWMERRRGEARDLSCGGRSSGGGESSGGSGDGDCGSGFEGGSGSSRSNSELAILDDRLAAFAQRVADQLGQLGAADAHPDLFPFGRADDGGILEISDMARLMVSAFSGDGTSYAPHVDNADGDGRQHVDLGRCLVRIPPRALLGTRALLCRLANLRPCANRPRCSSVHPVRPCVSPLTALCPIPSPGKQTCIYYLNQRWNAETDGGAFRAYLPEPLARRLGLPRGSVPAMDVHPAADTLLIFRADKLLHEVRPTRRLRFAATLWVSARSRCRHRFEDGATSNNAVSERHASQGPMQGPRTAPRVYYPKSEYGRCIEAALARHPFRPMA